MVSTFWFHRKMSSSIVQSRTKRIPFVIFIILLGAMSNIIKSINIFLPVSDIDEIVWIGKPKSTDRQFTTFDTGIAIPDNNNTVISLISFGNLIESYQVERCILTIRKRGLFDGIILLFTDDAGKQRYRKSILSWDNQTKIIIPHVEDLQPMEKIEKVNELRPKKYAQKTMIFKRFKTLHSKYIAEDSAMDSNIRYVLYIDVDNIIGSALSTFFKDYTKTVINEIEAPKNNTIKGFSFISMFRDKHLRGKMHSGVIMFDRLHELGCVNGWRNEMDSFFHSSDQSMLLRVLDDYDRYRCRAVALVHGHQVFANKRLMVDASNLIHNNIGEPKIRKKKKKVTALVLPTFIHVTKYRINRINNATLFEGFMRYALDLKNFDEVITEYIDLKEILSPTGK